MFKTHCSLVKKKTFFIYQVNLKRLYYFETYMTDFGFNISFDENIHKNLFFNRLNFNSYFVELENKLFWYLHSLL